MSKSHSMLLSLSIIVLPALSSVGYQVYQTQKAWQEKRVSVQRLNQEVKSTYQPLAVSLDYPKQSELQTMSEIRSLYQHEDKYEESTPDTVVVTPPASLVKPKKASSSEALDFDSLDLSELSPELAKRVQNAFEDDDSDTAGQEALSESEPVIEPDDLVENEAKYKGRLPALNLQTHMYASDGKHRSVKINGRELHEGEWLDNDIQLVSIAPQSIVIEFLNQPIKIPALYEWEG